jgi:hypothetical protein
MSRPPVSAVPEQREHRFSITEQYGLAGWLVLALIVLTGTALFVASVVTGGGAHEAARRGMPRSAALACTASPEASGARHRVEFFDDPLRQLFDACQ